MTKNRTQADKILQLAWLLHRQHGHPAGYDGPCWGPTLEEKAEARAIYFSQKEQRSR